MIRFLALFGILATFTLAYEKYGENFNSCVDTCSNGFDLQYTVDLNQGFHELKDGDLVEILEDIQSPSNQQCSKNVLLRIPFYKLFDGTIVKIELDYEDSKGTTFHIGNSPTNNLYGGDLNSTIFNAEIYANDSSLNYYMSSVNLCEQAAQIDTQLDLDGLLFLNESTDYLTPQTKVVIYVSEKWFRIDNVEKNTTFYYNSDYLFTFKQRKLSAKCKESAYLTQELSRASPFLYIGLNRVIGDAKLLPGSGLCEAKISFLNCFMKTEPDLDVDVNAVKYSHLDTDNIVWMSPLGHSEPASLVSEHHPACSAQGVLKLIFDKNSYKSIARFDLDFGQMVSGFTFNIGDSPTNNGYGGDSGSTSNSAEIHSNDNRLYVWMNTKYCGETLLYRIEYSLIQGNDKLTMFVSDERLEIFHESGDYHEIFRNPYLFNLNGQNVTCNCFDTRCYPGVQPDYEIYFGINRVIGGTYRPGVGLCSAKISWLQCKVGVRTERTKIDYDYVDWHNQTTNTAFASTADEQTTTSSTTAYASKIQETTSEETRQTSEAITESISKEAASSTSTNEPNTPIETETTTHRLETTIEVDEAEATTEDEKSASATASLLDILISSSSSSSSSSPSSTAEMSTNDKIKRGALLFKNAKLTKASPLVLNQSVIVLNSTSTEPIRAVQIKD